MQVKAFEKEWEEMMEGYTGVKLSMNGYWDREHKTESRYIHSHVFVEYEIVSKDKVRLVADDGSDIVISVYDVSDVL